MCYEFNSLLERARARALRKQQMQDRKRIETSQQASPQVAPAAEQPASAEAPREKETTPA